MKRRTFLLATAGGTASLVIGWSAWYRAAHHLAHQVAPSPDAITINGWIELSKDGGAILAVPRCEMGQGINPALAMLAAEELDLPLTRVRILEAPVGRIFAGVMLAESQLPALARPGLKARAERELRQLLGRTRMGVSANTGGSNTIRDLWLPVRHVAAHARALLVAAAARQASVANDQCRTVDGAVWLPDGRKLLYAELIPALADRPAATDYRLKDAANFKLAGRAAPRIDSAAKTDGRLQYAGDVRLSGMQYAALVMPPSLNARLVSFDAPAGIKVVRVPAGYGHGESLAVLAASWWVARQQADALKVVWDESADKGFDTAKIDAARRRALANEPGRLVTSLGDMKSISASPAQAVTATFEVPYLAHAQLETTACVAMFAAGRLRLWAPTQAPDDAIAAAARASGLMAASIELTVPPLGGAFGRRLDNDAVFQIAAIAAQMPGVPVQMMWTREQELRHDFYRPAASAKLDAVLDAGGNITALSMKVASQSIGNARLGRMRPGQTEPPEPARAGGLAYAIAQQSYTWVESPLGLPIGSWRSVGSSFDAFFIERFIDEIAAKLGRDPLALRELLLAKQARHRRVLSLAIEKSGYSAARQAELKTSGRAMGMALFESCGSVVAEVAEVSMAGERPRVHRVVCAIDCGFAVHPNIIAQQVEGAVIMGMGAALDPGIEVRGGVIIPSNFHDHPLPRMADIPVIETHIVPSAEPPAGVGEPALPPVAPAIANAVFALTGQRLRSLPLRLPAGQERE